jgi:23S rRNA (adenine2030-N6)-methyltransferase
MNYSHAYHAGSLADVFKHAALWVLLDSFKKKGKPFYFLDSHAGMGIYNLRSDMSLKTNEASKGILHFIHQKKWPDSLAAYRQLILDLNQTPAINSFIYPGSPEIAAHQCSEQDILLFNEKRRDVYSKLRKNYLDNPQIFCHQRDAYEFLPAMLPPKIKRALILIDPAYEEPYEDRQVSECVKLCLKKFAQGVFVIWYPIKSKIKTYHSLTRWLTHNKIDFLTTEYCWSSLLSENMGIQGSGLLIINPPWKIQINWPALKVF